MALRYLIYSTGTTYSDTIVRESATQNAGPGESYSLTDFVIPEIQPLYLWRITGTTHAEGAVPNTDANINAYLAATAPPPAPEDDASVGFVTGITSQKIDKVTGATGNLGTFNASGNLDDAGYTIAQLTGLTTYTFTGSGSTQVIENGNAITIYSTPATGTSVAWGDITGNISSQTDLWSNLTWLSGETATKLNISTFSGYTGTTQPIIDAALTGVTNLGSGTTLGSTSGRNVTLKSVSVLGGLTLSGDADNLIISGGSSGGGTWGSITGTLSNQTDLWDTLTGMTAETATKLDIAAFTGYSATTQQTITNIENDITYISGVTDTKLDIVAFTGYSATTDTRIGLIEDDITVLYDESLVNITGATNGLTKVGGKVVKLGGTLTESTVFTDSRTGATRVGLEYAGDYSTTFTNESLITKRYADTIAGGLIPKATVLVATTSGITLSGLQTVDGVLLQAGDRVLVKDQVSGETNGIYIASAGAWTRSTDFDGNPSGEVSAGNIIPVESGDTLYSTLWVLVTPNPITVGTTPLDFSLFSQPHEMIPGHGITIDANIITVDGASLVGNSLKWTGTTGNETYNVDVTGGTLGTILTGIDNDLTYISGVTDTKLDITAFTGYSATTGQEITNIENDITYISGVTDTKLDESIFNTYTGDTAPNEIFLTHSGGTELNTILATAIDWDVVVVSGSSFLFSGGTDIWIQEAGTNLFEISYNIPYNISSNSQIGIGANVILNNSIVLDVTAAAGLATRVAGAASVGLPTVILSLSAGDKLTLATFRTHQSGTATSSLTGSILIKKKNTLQ